MYHIGFRNGDKIFSVNGKPVEYFDDLPERVLMGGGGTVDLIRDGDHQTIDLPTALIGKLVERKKNSSGIISSQDSCIADMVPDTSNAYKAGLRRFDQITAVDGIATPFYEEYKKAIDAHKGQQVALTVERKGIDGYTACAGECRWHTWILSFG